MPTNFKQAVQKLIEATKMFDEGEVTPMAFSSERESCLALAMDFLAKDLGCELRGPMHLNSLAEFDVFAKNSDPALPWNSPGHFGEVFAQVLNSHNPRCGMFPGAHLMPESGWCMLNHFDAERLVLEQFKLRCPDKV